MSIQFQSVLAIPNRVQSIIRSFEASQTPIPFNPVTAHAPAEARVYDYELNSVPGTVNSQSPPTVSYEINGVRYSFEDTDRNGVYGTDEPFRVYSEVVDEQGTLTQLRLVQGYTGEQAEQNMNLVQVADEDERLGTSILEDPGVETFTLSAEQIEAHQDTLKALSAYAPATYLTANTDIISLEAAQSYFQLQGLSYAQGEAVEVDFDEFVRQAFNAQENNFGSNPQAESLFRDLARDLNVNEETWLGFQAIFTTLDNPDEYLANYLVEEENYSVEAAQAALADLKERLGYEESMANDGVLQGAEYRLALTVTSTDIYKYDRNTGQLEPEYEL